MKIGIDTRVKAQSPYYHLFIAELLEEIANTPSEHEFSVFVEAWEKEQFAWKKIEKSEHVQVIILKKNKSLLQNNLQSKKIFEAKKFHMMLFFGSSVPLGYKRPYIIVMESLKEIFFPRKEWLARKIHTIQLKNAIKNSFQILTLDKHSPLELNDHLNISEEKLGSISWFFPQVPKQEIPLDIDIALKHNLKAPYFLYDSWSEVHTNFDIILKSLKYLRESWVLVHILIICDQTTHDLDIRAKVIEYDLHTQIHFIGHVEAKLTRSYYEQSAWVLFTSIYESFPFQFSRAISYGARIFANDIPAHRDALWDQIIYLSPYSVHKVSQTLQDHLTERKNTPTRYAKSTLWSAKNTLQELMYYIEH